MSYAYAAGRGRQLSQFLDTVGDGSGTANMAVDGSVTPVPFKLTAPTGTVILLNRIIISFKDDGSIDSGAYGDVAAGVPLTTGLTFGIMDAEGTVVEDRSATKPVTTSTDWAAYCYDAGVSDFGSGTSSFQARYSFIKDGAPLYIPSGWSYFMQINDNLTHLVEHYVRCGAVILPE